MHAVRSELAGNQHGVFLGDVLDGDFDVAGARRDQERAFAVRLWALAPIASIHGFVEVAYVLPERVFTHA